MKNQLVFVDMLDGMDRITTLDRRDGIDELRGDQVVVLHTHFNCRQHSKVISRHISQYYQIELHHLAALAGTGLIRPQSAVLVSFTRAIQESFSSTPTFSSVPLRK